MTETQKPRKPYTFWIDQMLLEGLRRIKERDGMSESEQIRRAIWNWLKEKGDSGKAGRKRPATRKRP
jgi:hypothetical protein